MGLCARSGEITCPSHRAFTHDMLSPLDIAVDSWEAPSQLTVHLKRSKNDPFGVGTTICLGATQSVLCPVKAMLGYLVIRPQSAGPLFLFRDGSTLLRPRLVRALHQALQAAGVNCSGYSGHSFRIGAATTATRAGVSNSLIKKLGRWKSPYTFGHPVNNSQRCRPLLRVPQRPWLSNVSHNLVIAQECNICMLLCALLWCVMQGRI